MPVVPLTAVLPNHQVFLPDPVQCRIIVPTYLFISSIISLNLLQC